MKIPKRIFDKSKSKNFKLKIKQEEYNPRQIEPYWQKAWEESGIYEPDKLAAKKPFYNLMMFPYPSFEGLHVGNMYAFCGSDIYGRYMRMQGYSVFEPIGLDGFGIHSENYALKISQHPADVAKRTEANFYRQLHATGNAYDWSQKLETYDSNYYKWTQWIFIQLFKNGLAYRAEASVNWCPSCKTVLADEQVVVKKLEVRGAKLDNEVRNGRKSYITLQNPNSHIQHPTSQSIQVCERCATEVEERRLSQWFFRTTNYAQRLLDNLDRIDWSEKVKVAQRSWIGRSEGVEILFPFDVEKDSFIQVFTTRPDTIFGVTFMALAPEHPYVPIIMAKSKRSLQQEIRRYLSYSMKKTAEERIQDRSKSGIFTGFYCTNPLSRKKIPIFIADYVIGTYGTGAIMGVPAHDQRDWEFARKYKIDIVEVISGGDISRQAFTEYGVLINSEKFNGLKSDDGIKYISKYIKEHRLGTTAVTWHLRDWIISRQRYWGPPIPMIFCQKCADLGKSWFLTEEAKRYKILNPKHEILNKSKIQNSKVQKSLGFRNSDLDIPATMAGWYPAPESDLPVELPYIKDFKPTGTHSTGLRLRGRSDSRSSGQAGMGPLANHPEFYKVKCPECGSKARRETDVSDTFLDSAWYFLRYPSVNQRVSEPANQKVSEPVSQRIRSTESPIHRNTDPPNHRSTEFTDLPWNPEVTRRWLPVDMYIGGAEHAVLHLLYSRFITMVFSDLGLIDFEEPFTKFRAHGLLISKGAKMSKSRGNIVVPDAYIEKYGADALRCYLMFCGRFTQGGDFQDSGIEGMHRFLNRVWRLVQKNFQFPISNFQLSGEAAHLMHKTIKRVTEDIESLDYNTAIAAIMEWVGTLEKRAVGSDESVVDRENKKNLQSTNYELITREEVKILLLLLAPFAPHMAEELWQWLRRSQISADKETDLRRSEQISFSNPRESVHVHPWPEYDPKLAESDTIVLVVQINGKLRDRIITERGIDKKRAQELVLTLPKVTKYLGKAKPKRTIFVPDRLINFVV